MMKAALLEQLGSLTVREVADPDLSPYGALCDLLYGATCSGTDIHLIDGHVDWAITAAPTIIGHESIGRVKAVGEKVRNYHVGDLVTRVGAPPAADGSYQSTWGGFATLGVAVDHWAMAEDGLPAEKWSGATVNQILPADFDPRAATMMTTWRETLSYITRIGLAAGQRALILGSGGVGLAFAAHAANIGAGEIVMTGNAAREQLARRVGATAHLDYKADDLTERLAAAAGDGFDHVIDAVGSQRTVDQAVAKVAVGGLVGIYGIGELGKTKIDRSLARGEFTEFSGGYDEAETHERVVEFVQAGLRRAQSSRKLDLSVWLEVDSAFPKK